MTPFTCIVRPQVAPTHLAMHRTQSSLNAKRNRFSSIIWKNYLYCHPPFPPKKIEKSHIHMYAESHHEIIDVRLSGADASVKYIQEASFMQSVTARKHKTFFSYQGVLILVTSNGGKNLPFLACLSGYVPSSPPPPPQKKSAVSSGENPLERQFSRQRSAQH